MGSQQPRGKNGKFIKKVYKPSPFLNPMKRPAAVRARTKAAQYVTTVPRGFVFMGEPSSPPRPMGLREKASWEKKSAIRKKKIKKLSNLRRRRTKKIFSKVWHKVW